MYFCMTYVLLFPPLVHSGEDDSISEILLVEFVT